MTIPFVLWWIQLALVSNDVVFIRQVEDSCLTHAIVIVLHAIGPFLKHLNKDFPLPNLLPSYLF